MSRCVSVGDGRNGGRVGGLTEGMKWRGGETHSLRNVKRSYVISSRVGRKIGMTMETLTVTWGQK